MNLSELIIAVGDKNVRFQNLDNDASDLSYSAKRGTKITFGTDVPLDLNGTSQLGLVLWFDREAVKAALAGAPASTTPETGTEKVAATRQPEPRDEPIPTTPATVGGE